MAEDIKTTAKNQQSKKTLTHSSFQCELFWGEERGPYVSVPLPLRLIMLE